MIREALQRIASGYPRAQQEPLAGHPLANFIRREFPRALQEKLEAEGERPSLTAQGTKFVGSWAHVPWVSILDTRITSTTQRGVYVVYLFDHERIWLALGIGVTNSDRPSRLQLIRHIHKNYPALVGVKHGPLAAEMGRVGQKYGDALAYYLSYEASDVPNEEVLVQDLAGMLNLLDRIALASDALVLQMAMDEESAAVTTAEATRDIEIAFAQTPMDESEGKKGKEPYWHVQVNGKTKPLKAVYSTLTGMETREFNTIEARRHFEKNGFTCLDIRNSPVAVDGLAIVGTWRYGDDELQRVRRYIDAGGWASGWSFKLHPHAKPLLRPPFDLFINRGSATLTLRMKVSKVQATDAKEGAESPWPAHTFDEHRGTTIHGGEKRFRTWFLITEMEELTSPLSPDDVLPCAPMSTTGNLLHQHVFGYFTLRKQGSQPSDRDTSYGLAEAVQDLFVSSEDLATALRMLRRKKNLILTGPPGVGKTIIAERLAYLLIGAVNKANIGRIQFHQSYSYEDFVQGYRPTPNGGFSVEKGAFQNFCNIARKSPNEKFVFLIDEFNRGNLSKIFGEILMLIEPDKRDEKWGVTLSYGHESEGRFHVPDNVYLIGMMNTADRSLAIVDYAFRRRFAFYDLEPQFESDGFKRHLEERGVDSSLSKRIVGGFAQLNERIRSDRNLGVGFQIGHSFFCGGIDTTLTESDFENIVKYEIAPLLKEYWIDMPDEELQSIQQQILKA